MQDTEYDIMRQVEDTYWWYLSLRGHVVSALKDSLSSTEHPVILDAGCGTGGMLQHLREADPAWQLQGLDFSPLALAHAKQRGFEQLIQASIDAIPSEDARFDAVVSLDVLYHEGVDQTKAMNELSRILKPGGTLILNLPAFDFLYGSHDIAVKGTRRYNAGQVRTLLQGHGFEIEQLHYWNAGLFFPILLWRMLSRFLPSGEKKQSDLAQLPPPLNHALALLTKMDITLCRLLHVPFGTSVFAVARKKYTSPSPHA